MSGRHARTAGLIVALVAWPLAPAAQGAGRTYELPGHGALELTVPPDWSEQLERPGPGAPPTITFRSRTGAAFQVVVTPGWNPSGSQRQPPAHLRDTIERQGRAMLPQAVERQIALQEIQGSTGAGYYFTLTDRAPQPGEYAVVTQGMLAVGDLVVAFTVLGRDPRGPEREAALAVLRSAVHRP